MLIVFPPPPRRRVYHPHLSTPAYLPTNSSTHCLVTFLLPAPLPARRDILNAPPPPLTVLCAPFIDVQRSTVA